MRKIKTHPLTFLCQEKVLQYQLSGWVKSSKGDLDLFQKEIIKGGFGVDITINEIYGFNKVVYDLGDFIGGRDNELLLVGSKLIL